MACGAIVAMAALVGCGASGSHHAAAATTALNGPYGAGGPYATAAPTGAGSHTGTGTPGPTAGATASPAGAGPSGQASPGSGKGAKASPDGGQGTPRGQATDSPLTATGTPGKADAAGHASTGMSGHADAGRVVRVVRVDGSTALERNRVPWLTALGAGVSVNAPRSVRPGTDSPADAAAGFYQAFYGRRLPAACGYVVPAQRAGCAGRLGAASGRAGSLRSPAIGFVVTKGAVAIVTMTGLVCGANGTTAGNCLGQHDPAVGLRVPLPVRPTLGPGRGQRRQPADRHAAPAGRGPLVPGPGARCGGVAGRPGSVTGGAGDGRRRRGPRESGRGGAGSEMPAPVHRPC